VLRDNFGFIAAVDKKTGEILWKDMYMFLML
jgi:hypothetical protein